MKPDRLVVLCILHIFYALKFTTCINDSIGFEEHVELSITMKGDKTQDYHLMMTSILYLS